MDEAHRVQGLVTGARGPQLLWKFHAQRLRVCLAAERAPTIGHTSHNSYGILVTDRPCLTGTLSPSYVCTHDRLKCAACFVKIQVTITLRLIIGMVAEHQGDGR